MSNCITVELCAEDRKRLDTLTEALAAVAAEYGAIIRNMPDAVTGLAAAPAAPVETKPAEESAPAVTVEDIRALVQRLVSPGSTKKQEATEIVKSYARRVGDIPHDKLEEAWKRLKALEEGVEA